MEDHIKLSTAKIDALFGFESDWSIKHGGRSWAFGSLLIIDQGQIHGLCIDQGIDAKDVGTIVDFSVAHEKAHHLQDRVWPSRDQEAETRVMEIEADLIATWALFKLNQSEDPKSAVLQRRLGDVYRVAKAIGDQLGDPKSGSSRDHPRPHQREMAIVNGGILACLYTAEEMRNNEARFAQDVRDVATRLERAW